MPIWFLKYFFRITVCTVKSWKSMRKGGKKWMFSDKLSNVYVLLLF